ncbi:MAG TPA: SRPBCC family protein [Rhizomicrobium sp.]|jgi:hypothetical protein
MASLRQEITIEANAVKVWDALRDFGAVRTRVAPGFVVECRMDGDARIVTFHNGAVARERLVDLDDESMRLVYSIAPNERVEHYSAAVQVRSKAEATCRLIWTIDLLPNELAPYVRSQMELAAARMKSALEKR